ncbi:hypothetical protein F7725_004199 [Dissostichus mawsoni]|uniref:Uncharacterized protein n=1 Tax=Dissostichus mawsoni TaxID=36200 RepID=A0A7J5XI16_DISMA|nr:hypothetical protein F7725_004199 [Dissostichus mawsoni]
MMRAGLGKRCALIPEDADHTWKTVADPQRATEVFRRNLLGQREEMAPLRLSVDIREDVDKQEMAIISFYRSRQTKWSRPLRWTLEGDVATGDGVTRHLFSLIMKNLQHGFHINFGNSNTTLLFEGQQDHLIPCTSQILAESDLFLMAGRMMGHSFIHGGPCLSGLCPAVIHVLLGVNMDTATIQLEDIADLDIRQTVGPTVLDHIEWPLELSSDDEGSTLWLSKVRLQSIFATSPKQLRQLVTFWVGWDVPMKGMQMHVELLRHHVLERLYTRLQQALQQRPLDIDFLEFLCTQEMVFINTITSQIEIPQEITDVLAELSCLLWSYRESQQQPITALTQQSENLVGRPRLEMSEHYLVYLLEMGMPAVTANVRCVKSNTVQTDE